MYTIEEIDKRLTQIKEICGTIEDCPEAQMAELRIDIDDISTETASLREMISSNTTQLYNFKVGLTILSVFVFILYIIR